MSNVDRHAPGTPSWFDLMTPDPEGARKFYGEIFGWTFDIGGPESGHYTMCKLGGRNAAGMGKRPDNAPFPAAWNVYFSTEDVDAHCGRVREAGGQVMMPPMDVMDAGRLAFCMDPTGAAFGFWQPRVHSGAQVVDEPGAMAWTEVLTRAGEQARDFYAKVMGLDPRKMEGMEYHTLHKGEKAVAGVMQMDEKWPAEVPPHWMAYFAVGDADAAATRIKELGGKVNHGPFDTPYGRIAVVSDPYGAVFSIIKLSAAGA
jgi:hypothetical protein